MGLELVNKNQVGIFGNVVVFSVCFVQFFLKLCSLQLQDLEIFSVISGEFFLCSVISFIIQEIDDFRDVFIYSIVEFWNDEQIIRFRDQNVQYSIEYGDMVFVLEYLFGQR